MKVMNTTKEPAADPAAVTTETAPKIAAKRVAAELAVAKQMQKTKTKKATAVKEVLSVTEDAAPPQATEAVQISGLISDGGPSPPTEFGLACTSGLPAALCSLKLLRRAPVALGHTRRAFRRGTPM